MKEKRIEKEIKKAQKKGIYNPKLKLGIVALILVIGTVIGVSYAYYTGTSTNTLTISGTVSKKIKVTVQSGGNGTVSGSPQTVDYGTQAAFTMSPNAGYQYKSVSCNYNSNTSHSGNTLYITPKTSKDVTCTVEFEEIPYLRTKILKANTSKGTISSDNFKTGCPTSSSDSCSGVYEMEDYNSSTSLNYDNPGGTSYYFRGEAKNNYVQFANKIWRIVRINGDGSIRLVLDGDIGTSEFNTEYQGYKYVGYTYDNGTPCTNASPCKSVDIATNVEEQIGTTDHGGENSTIKAKLEQWYYDNLRAYDNYITYGTYCNDTSFGSGSETGTLYYGPYTRLWNGSSIVKPQLTCPDPTANSSESQFVKDGNHTYGGVYKLKIGLLSGDEIVLAGFKPTNSSGVTESNYLYYTSSSSGYFWNSSPYVSSIDNDSVFVGVLTSRNFSYSNDVAISYSVRPVINLKQDVIWSGGNGTKESPFVIKN